MFGNSAAGGPKKIDPRVAGIIAVGAISAAATLVGDRVTFVTAPRNILEKLVSIPQILFAKLFATMGYDAQSVRVFSDISAGLFWVVGLLFLGFYLYNLAVKRFIEPMVIKNMIETKRREKELINKYGDDTL